MQGSLIFILVILAGFGFALEYHTTEADIEVLRAALTVPQYRGNEFHMEDPAEQRAYLLFRFRTYCTSMSTAFLADTRRHIVWYDPETRMTFDDLLACSDILFRSYNDTVRYPSYDIRNQAEDTYHWIVTIFHHGILVEGLSPYHVLNTAHRIMGDHHSTSFMYAFYTLEFLDDYFCRMDPEFLIRKDSDDDSSFFKNMEWTTGDRAVVSAHALEFLIETLDFMADPDHVKELRFTSRELDGIIDWRWMIGFTLSSYNGCAPRATQRNWSGERYLAMFDRDMSEDQRVMEQEDDIWIRELYLSTRAKILPTLISYHDQLWWHGSLIQREPFAHQIGLGYVEAMRTMDPFTPHDSSLSSSFCYSGLYRPMCTDAVDDRAII